MPTYFRFQLCLYTSNCHNNSSTDCSGGPFTYFSWVKDMGVSLSQWISHCVIPYYISKHMHKNVNKNFLNRMGLELTFQPHLFIKYLFFFFSIKLNQLDSLIQRLRLAVVQIHFLYVEVPHVDYASLHVLHALFHHYLFY